MSCSSTDGRRLDVEKLRLLVHGALVRPLDILDLVMHATPLLLVALKLWRQLRAHRP